ncbi:MAG: hypothetical protein L3J92_04520 [Thermoplasmata archaeon]|nr:hypothetical protein [Thermoplasmata archaeon]
MNERIVATGLFALPFVYLAALVLSQFPLTDVGLYFGFAACATIALLLGLGGSRGQLLAVFVDVALAIVVATALLAFSTFGGLASQLTVGVLVGLPFLASALSWRERSGPAHRTVALAVSIVIGTALLAARSAVLESGGGGRPADFVQAFFTVNVSQVQGLIRIATGGSEPGLPLRAVFDPTFDALCALAAAGVLLLALRPQSGSHERLPVAVSLEPTPIRSDVERLAPFSESQRLVFESRSSTVPPTGAWPPGLEAVALAALATTLFLSIAFATPLYAPLLLAGGTAAVLLLVAVSSSRARVGGRLLPPGGAGP